MLSLQSLSVMPLGRLYWRQSHKCVVAKALLDKAKPNTAETASACNFFIAFLLLMPDVKNNNCI